MREPVLLGFGSFMLLGALLLSALGSAAWTAVLTVDGVTGIALGLGLLWTNSKRHHVAHRPSGSSAQKHDDDR